MSNNIIDETWGHHLDIEIPGFMNYNHIYDSGCDTDTVLRLIEGMGYTHVTTISILNRYPIVDYGYNFSEWTMHHYHQRTVDKDRVGTRVFAKDREDLPMLLMALNA